MSKSFVPVWLKVIDVRTPRSREPYINGAGQLRVCEETTSSIVPILGPNNVYGLLDVMPHIIALHFDKIDWHTWEVNGSHPGEYFRVPSDTDAFIGVYGELLGYDCDSPVFSLAHWDDQRRICLRKKATGKFISITVGPIPASFAIVTEWERITDYEKAEWVAGLISGNDGPHKVLSASLLPVSAPTKTLLNEVKK